GQENAAPSPKNPTPSPVMSRADAASSPGAAKPATVRVLSSYCKASFNGRVPQKPARGSCPVCQKELILLPNGDIKPAAGFDLGTYQNEGPGAKGGGDAAEPAVPEMPKESGTRLLVKKYAADPGAAKAMEPPAPAARPAARRPDPLDTPSPVAASAETESSDESNPLPGWLDDTKGSGGSDDMVKPQPDTDMAIDVVQPTTSDADDRTIKVEDEPAPRPPSGVRARPPIAAKMPSVSPGRPPTAVSAPPPPEDPQPDVDLLPPDPPKKPAGRFGSSGTRRSPVGAAPAPVSSSIGAEETSGGRVFVALILALLPIAACAGLLTSRDKLKHELIAKAGARFVKGFQVLHNRMFPPPPPPKPVIEEKKTEPEPPKEEPPKPDPDQQKKDEAAISTLYTQIIREQRDLKQNLVAASPEQKAQLEQVQRDLEAKRSKLKEKQDLYRKMYGKD